jgi:acyl phosphate:glycerol-3-phosphate acyltransferase
MSIQFLLFIILAYLIGSIPFGKLVGKKYGIDIQKKGSGNIGFTNSLRTLGLKPAALVLAADILKGFIPVKIALSLFPQNQVLIITLLAILGNIFPIWLKFKGGKGVSTGFGAILAINPIASIIPIVVFVLVFIKKRIVSISSILATGSLVLVSYFIYPNLTLFYLLLFVIILWTHRENIARLIRRTEKRL